VNCSHLVIMVTPGHIFRPPPGCLQYFTGLSGRISTFNFDSGREDSIHLADQNYRACIRRETSFCCVQYWPCERRDDSFSLNNVNLLNSAANGNACFEDFVRIEGASLECRAGSPFVTSICGRVFSPVTGALAAAAVCDCTPPFWLDVVTDGGADLLQAATRDRGQ